MLFASKQPWSNEPSKLRKLGDNNHISIEHKHQTSMKIKTHWNAFGQNEVLEMHLAPFLDQLSELEQKN